MSRVFVDNAANYYQLQGLSVPPSGPTLTGWIKTTKVTSSQVLLGKWTGSGFGSDWVLALAGDKPFFGFSNGITYGVVGATSVSTGVWTHLAGSYDGVSLKVFKDGVLDGTFVQGGMTVAGSGTAFLVGRDASGGANPVAGRLFDVALWDRPLAIEEIEAIGAGSVSPARLIANLNLVAPLWGNGAEAEMTIAGKDAGYELLLNGAINGDNTDDPPVGSPWSAYG